jgi:putative membrane protein
MMWWYGPHGMGWGGWLLMTVLWVALVAAAVAVVVRLVSTSSRGPVLGRDAGATGPAFPAPPPGEPRRETAEEILDRRFAAGEIDADTYRAQRAVLAEARRTPAG